MLRSITNIDLKIALVIGAVFFILGTLTLTHYNTNYDAGNHLTRGQAYLNYYFTGQGDFSNLPPFEKYWQKPESLVIDSDTPFNEITRRSIYQHDSITFDYLLTADGDGHPPTSDILSSIFNLILFQKLGVINDIDSYRIYGVLLAACLVGIVYWWNAKTISKFAGIIAALALASYPLFWAHTHFNTEKDIPQTVFYGLFLYSMWQTFITKKPSWILLSGLFLGLGVGTKLNIAFAIFIISPWLFLFILPKLNFKKLRLKKQIKDNMKFFTRLSLVPLIALGIFFVSWPYLWQDPIAGITKMLRFYTGLGLSKGGEELLPVQSFNSYALQTILYITPPVLLILTFVGVIAALIRFKTKRETVGLLFVFWLIVPIIRVTLPGTNIHGGVRQIMEYIPAMALLSGLGANFLVNIFKRNILLKGLIVSLLAIMLVIPLVRLHPNEELYFNFLMGGLNGAKARDYPYWGETYGSPYRNAIAWINQNAPVGSRVVFAYELMPNIPHVFLREDLAFSNTLRSGYLREGEYALTLVSKGTDTRSYYDMYLEKFIEPVYRTTIDGVDVLKVWKNDEEHLKVPISEKIDPNTKLEITNDGILITLATVRKLSRLEIDYSDTDCSKLTNGIIHVSKDGSSWTRLPGNLPDDWRISIMREQPSKGRFVEPFVGQEASFIRLDLSPVDTCLKNVKATRLLYFE